MVAATWVFDTIHQTLIYIQRMSFFFQNETHVQCSYIITSVYEYCVTYFGDIVHLFSVPK
jgi:hypothetical protein